MADVKRMEEGLGHDENGHEKVVKKENNDQIESEKEEKMRRQVEHNEAVKVEEQPLITQKTKRVATLDAFRGLTIVLMILVDDAGGAYARIDHSPWNGCTLADFVMPFFLFIVGVAIALAFKKVPKLKHAIKRVVTRTLKLLFWGIILQGGYSHAPDDLEYGVDMKKIRWCGILQRIALVYMIVALVEILTIKRRPEVLKPGLFSIFTAYQWQCCLLIGGSVELSPDWWINRAAPDPLVGFIAFVIYMITIFATYVPDWTFTIDGEKHVVKCGMRGHLGPACNAVGYVDRQVWGINHLYNGPVWIRLKACTLSYPSAGPLRKDAPSWCRAPFEPEGLLSSISAILSGTIGIHYGHVLIHFKGHAERLKQWIPMALGLLIVAIILHFTDAIPINKQLYSFSYVCFTAGAAGLVFSAFYLLIDVWGFRTPFLFLEWIGMNAMLVFVMAAQGIFAGFFNGWYYENTDNTLVYWIQKHVFVDVWNSNKLGTLLYVIFAEITFWGVVSGILHKMGIYWKL